MENQENPWWWEQEREDIHTSYGFQDITENIIVDPIPIWAHDIYNYKEKAKTVKVEWIAKEDVWFKDAKVILTGQDVKEGDLIGELTGEVISRERAAKRAAMVHHPYTLWMCNDDKSADILETFKIDLVLDSSYWGNDLRFVGQSCDPNCEYRYAVKYRKPIVLLRAIKDIGAGDEITVDYYMDPDTAEENKLDMPNGCFCGVTNCRFKK